MPLTIVASIRAEVGQEERIASALAALVEPTRAESGCIQYDLHRDNDNPAHFLFFENWESRELWQRHMESPHLTQYQRDTEGLVAEFQLYEMTRTA